MVAFPKYGGYMAFTSMLYMTFTIMLYRTFTSILYRAFTSMMYIVFTRMLIWDIEIAFRRKNDLMLIR